MPARPRPTIRLRRLAGTLRRLRAEKELSRDDVSEATGINIATLYRIETARVRPQARTLAAMLTVYEVANDRRTASEPSDPSRSGSARRLSRLGSQAFQSARSIQPANSRAGTGKSGRRPRSPRDIRSLICPVDVPGISTPRSVERTDTASFKVRWRLSDASPFSSVRSASAFSLGNQIPAGPWARQRSNAASS